MKRTLFLAAAAALIAPVSAYAFFPPLNHAAPPKLPPTTPVKISGVPDPVKPPHVAATPEPATMLTGLIGLGLAAGYRLRNKKTAVA